MNEKNPPTFGMMTAIFNQLLSNMPTPGMNPWKDGVEHHRVNTSLIAYYGEENVKHGMVIAMEKEGLMSVDRKTGTDIRE